MPTRYRAPVLFSGAAVEAGGEGGGPCGQEGSNRGQIILYKMRTIAVAYSRAEKTMQEGCDGEVRGKREGRRGPVELCGSAT